MKLIIDPLIDPLMYLISYRWEIGLDSCVKCPPSNLNNPILRTPPVCTPAFLCGGLRTAVTSAHLALPASVFGPVDAPPCVLHTRLPCMAAFRHCWPDLLDWASHSVGQGYGEGYSLGVLKSWLQSFAY